MKRILLLTSLLVLASCGQAMSDPKVTNKPIDAVRAELRGLNTMPKGLGVGSLTLIEEVANAEGFQWAVAAAGKPMARVKVELKAVTPESTRVDVSVTSAATGPEAETLSDPQVLKIVEAIMTEHIAATIADREFDPAKMKSGIGFGQFGVGP